MKQKISWFGLVLFLSASLSAQDIQERQRPKFTISGGLTKQVLFNEYRPIFVSFGVHLSEYAQIGVVYNHYFEGDGSTYDYPYGSLAKGSFHIGLHMNSFFHGKFTGRKSGFYIGPDIRLGVYKQTQYAYIYTPVYTEVIRTVSVQSFMALFRMGKQWNFGKHIVLELNLPMGIEYRRNPEFEYISNVVTGYYAEDYFVIMPSLSIGYKF